MIPAPQPPPSGVTMTICESAEPRASEASFCARLGVGWTASKLMRRMSGRRRIDIVDFAMITGMRLGEIVRIKWADYDAQARQMWVRDRKDPKNKMGNDWEVPMLGEAYSIIVRQPHTDERIFPYSAEMEKQLRSDEVMPVKSADFLFS